MATGINEALQRCCALLRIAARCRLLSLVAARCRGVRASSPLVFSPMLPRVVPHRFLLSHFSLSFRLTKATGPRQET